MSEHPIFDDLVMTLRLETVVDWDAVAVEWQRENGWLGETS